MITLVLIIGVLYIVARFAFDSYDPTRPGTSAKPEGSDHRQNNGDTNNAEDHR